MYFGVEKHSGRQITGWSSYLNAFLDKYR